MERYQVAGDAAGHNPATTPDLAAAQRKLEQLRQAFRANQIERPPAVSDGRLKSPPIPQGHAPRPNFSPNPPPSLPAHLGWHSAPATKAYRQALHNQSPNPSPTPADSTENHRYTKNNNPNSSPIPARPTTNFPEPDNTQRPLTSQTITVPPDIALAILRQKLAAPGRIWLLLRHIDQEGQGWITAEKARQTLADEHSPLAVCGRRQLRNLLTAGDDIFWDRDTERIWLRSLAKVAAVLGLSRLHGRSVQLPLPPLLQSIGTVRAHLYATFHSGRSKPDDTAERPSGPISRQTLKQLTTATRRTQRLYEKRAGVRQQTNYAIGNPHTTEGEQNMAWQLGQAYFRFKDHKGLVGPANKQYLAWQLPNSYDGPHDINSKGHQRRINRQLTDLLTIGITGNGKRESIKPDPMTNDTEDGYKKKMFFEQSAQAAKKYNREPDQDLYWQEKRIGSANGNFWHALPARPVDNSQ